MTSVTRHYEDFVLRIESAGGGRHRVRVTDSSEGTGYAELILLPELVEACAAMPLDAGEPSGGGRPLVPAVPIRSRYPPRELAGRLFKALFQGQVRTLYEGSRAASPLRIRIAVDPRETDLARLPWEILYDADRKEFLCFGRSSLLVRHLDVRESTEVPPPPSRLCILAVASSPRDTVELDLEQEMRHLRELSEREVFDLEILDRPTLHWLRQELQRSDADVLHFMGHGEVDSRTGRGELVFESPDGLSERVPGEALATTLRDLTSLRLVVLNACRTATMPRGGDSFAGVAPALVQAGLPAVVAMQRPISDPAAIAFSGTFYRRLAAGDSIEQAVVEGRHAIHAADPDGMEWAIPVLFSRRPQRPIVAAAGEPEDELVQRYLAWVVEQTEEVSLPGLARVGRRRHAALDTVFVVPRVELTNPYERARSRQELEDEARRLDQLLRVEGLSADERYRRIWRRIGDLTRDPAAARHLPGEPESGAPAPPDLALDDALGRFRRLVLLGDAGSGKSTVVRWLARRCARARMGTEGPIPVLIRLADFAAERARSPERRLVEVLGHHVGGAYGRPAVLSSGEVLDPQPLNALLRRRLAAGEILLLLDGLDEVADPSLRDEVAREIEALLDVYVPADGGNRMVMTSRLVGYRRAGLDADIAHLMLAPLAPEAADRCCETWVEALHRATVHPWDEAARLDARRQAEILKQALAELRRQEGGELTGNPFLVTLLALVFRRAGKSFPRRRIELYELAVDFLVDRWRKRSGGRFDKDVVLAILLPLAAEIHDGSACGVIDEAGLREVLGRHLPEDEAEGFLRVVREQVGLLTVRGEGVYGFLHLAFQEYLAACWLAAPDGDAVERLLGKLDDPRWREPLVMALGRLSAERTAAETEALLDALLHARDPLGPGAGNLLLPRSALLLTAALPETVRVPAPPVASAARQLLTAYAEAPALAGIAERAFVELLAGEHRAEVEGVLEDTLQHPAVAGHELVAARLVLAARRFTSKLAAALIAAWHRDAAPWPIDRALREVAAHDPRLLNESRRSLRRTLRSKPRLARRFAADAAWRSIGLLVYGAPAWERFHRDVPWLTREVVEALKAERPPAALVPELRRRLSQPETAADAAVALVALGEPAPAESEAGLGRTVAHLSAEPPAVDPVFDLLGELAGRWPAERWLELARTILHRLPLRSTPPSRLLRLTESAPRSARPWLLGELWRFLLSGFHHDPVYNLAVVLDTRGDALASSPRLLAESLARLGPGQPEDPAAAALQVLADLPQAYDFFRGWALVCLKSLLAEAGLLDEALRLAVDLSDRFDARRHTLAQLVAADDPRSAWIDDPPASGVSGGRADLLSAPTLPDLLERLDGMDDRCRYRTVLALHGDRSVTRHRRSVRRLGRGALERLAREWLDRRDDEPRLAVVLLWTFETVEHDDPQAIESWAALAAVGGEAAEEAEVILGEVHTLHPRAWPAVLTALRDGPDRARRALTRSVAVLLGRGCFRAAWWTELEDILPGLAEASWDPGKDGATFLLDGPSVVADAALAAWRAASGLQAVALAERRYDSARQPWAELFRRPPAAIEETLRAIGRQRLVTERHRARYAAAAERLVETPPVLGLLLGWLDRRLCDHVQDGERDARLTADLLGVTAATAERLPDTFTGEVRSLPFWQRRLREVAEEGDWFPARQAALTLLALGGRVTEDVLRALRAALRDVAPVQGAAFRSAGRYREIEPGIMEALVEDLGDESPARGLATGRLLAALAKNALLQPEVRRRILQALAAAVCHPGSRREVHRLAEDVPAPGYRAERVERLGRLDQLLHRLLIEVSGMWDLLGRSSWSER